MKIAFIADIHFGVRGDSTFFQKKQETFFEEKFFPYLKEHNIKTVFSFGDLMDRRKYINYTTLFLVKEAFIKKLQSNGIDSHFIIGNHDIYFKNRLDYNTYDALFDLTGIQVYSSVVEKDIGGTKFIFVPWITKENHEEIEHALYTTDASICCGHFEVAGVCLNKGVMNYNGRSLSSFSKFKYTFSGHFHLPSVTGNFIMIGSPLQYTWNDYGDEKRIIVYDTDTNTYESVSFDDDIFIKLYYNDDEETPIIPDYARKPGLYIKLYVTNKNDPFYFERYCQTVKSYGPNKFDIIENTMFISEGHADMNEKNTIEVILDYIDDLDTTGIDLIRNDLKILMTKLYTEAHDRREL